MVVQLIYSLYKTTLHLPMGINLFSSIPRPQHACTMVKQPIFTPYKTIIVKQLIFIHYKTIFVKTAEITTELQHNYFNNA